MKNLVLIFTVFSAMAFGQQKRNADQQKKDSVAIKNVNAILNYSKKSFSLNSEVNNSDLNKNLDQLLINNINFNTVINSRAVNTVDVGSFSKPRVDAIDMLGRQIMNLQIYKSK